MVKECHARVCTMCGRMGTVVWVFPTPNHIAAPFICSRRMPCMHPTSFSPVIHSHSTVLVTHPQVSEMELEAIARMSTEALLDEGVVEGAGGDATRGLLGQYGPTPLRSMGTAQTPARTAPSGDRIMMEAQNLARLTNLTTPLEGGEGDGLGEGPWVVPGICRFQGHECH
jgi:hypothetical protein